MIYACVLSARILSIIIENYSVHIYPQICSQKNFVQETARFAQNIILYMRAICHRVRIYIHIINHPNRSHAVEKR